jgi:hypothetical protein
VRWNVGKLCAAGLSSLDNNELSIQMTNDKTWRDFGQRDLFEIGFKET